MTIPEEEYRSIISAREFLYALLDPKRTPRVPKTIRQQARRIVKHMPFDCMLRDRYPDANLPR